MADFTHIDGKGRARMVNVSGKPMTERWAEAEACVRVGEALFSKLQENTLEKGDATAVARIAGIQAAKRTAELIPLCHSIGISSVEVDIKLEAPDTVRISTFVKAKDVTGVEMEALTAAAVAALTIYDLGKALDRGMVIEEIKLMEKGGGRSGEWSRNEDL